MPKMSTEEQAQKVADKARRDFIRNAQREEAKKLREAHQRKAERKRNRAAETQRKIKWGGLVIVAGAEALSEAVIVGVLARAANSSNPNLIRELEKEGIQRMVARQLSRRAKSEEVSDVEA